MPDIVSNVSFDTVAREMRCKWSADNDKASLVACQDVLNKHLAALKVFFFSFLSTWRFLSSKYNLV